MASVALSVYPEADHWNGSGGTGTGIGSDHPNKAAQLRMTSERIASEKTDDLLITPGGTSDWYGPGGHEKEGFEYYIGVMLVWLCTVPLFCITMLVHSIYYGQFRDESCDALNRVALMQVIAWPIVIVMYLGGCALWFASGSAHLFQSCCCNGCFRVTACCKEPAEWTKLWVTLPLIMLSCGLLALESYIAHVIRTDTSDPTYCGESGLKKLTIATSFAGLWGSVLQLGASVCISKTPDLSTYRVKSHRQHIESQAVGERALNRYLNSTLTARPRRPAVRIFACGSDHRDGQRALLFNLIGFGSSNRLPKPITLLALSPESQIARFKSSQARAFQKVSPSDEHWPIAETLPPPNLSGAAIESPVPAKLAPSNRIVIQPKPSSSWKLSADVMTIVFRHTGPGSLSVVSRVCTSWHHMCANRQRLLSAWWQDATGDRTSSSAGSGDATAAAALNPNTQALMFQYLMRSAGFPSIFMELPASVQLEPSEELAVTFTSGEIDFDRAKRRLPLPLADLVISFFAVDSML